MQFKRIKELRAACGWTQQQVADMLQIKRDTYASYETGKTEIRAAELSALADIYDTSVEYLLGRRDIFAPYPRSETYKPLVRKPPNVVQ